MRIPWQFYEKSLLFKVRNATLQAKNSSGITGGFFRHWIWNGLFENLIMVLTRAFFFALVFLFSACGDKDSFNPDPILDYPMEPGTEWIYAREQSLRIYESETSDKVIDGEDFRDEIRVRIEKDTVLWDTLAVKQFTSISTMQSEASREYCRLEDRGLVNYAYENGGSAFILKKSGKRLPVIPESLLQFYSPEITVDAGTLFVYPVPRLSLALPLRKNSRWTYLQPLEALDLKIDKEVSGAEKILTEAGSFSCFRIDYRYSGTNAVTNTVRTEWISESGLIRYQLLINRITLTSADGEEMSCSLSEKVILKALVIP
jgi:hypothetical protein